MRKRSQIRVIVIFFSNVDFLQSDLPIVDSSAGCSRNNYNYIIGLFQQPRIMPNINKVNTCKKCKGADASILGRRVVGQHLIYGVLKMGCNP